MIRTFYEMKHFTKKWLDLGFSDDELSQLQQILLENPKAGDVMRGTGGLRKIRFAFPNSGKSGSVRVCYIDIEGALEIISLMCSQRTKKRISQWLSEMPLELL